jgi:hypothetical protein
MWYKKVWDLGLRGIGSLFSVNCSEIDTKPRLKGVLRLKVVSKNHIYQIFASRSVKFTHMGDVQSRGWPLKFTQLLSQSEK